MGVHYEGTGSPAGKVVLGHPYGSGSASSATGDDAARGVRPLPDFQIGAHAAIAGLVLLTRDATRYRTYFPALEIIAP